MTSINLKNLEELKNYIRYLSLKPIEEAKMQPEQFINFVIEKSKDYLEEEDEKIALSQPILFTLNLDGRINQFPLPDNSDELIKYRSLTLVRRMIKAKGNSIIAYAIIKKSLTTINTLALSYNQETQDAQDRTNQGGEFNNAYYNNRRMLNAKERETKKNQNLTKELKDAPQSVDALRIFYASIKERKEMVIPYTRDYDKLTFEGFKEIRVNRISKGLMFNLLD